MDSPLMLRIRFRPLAGAKACLTVLLTIQTMLMERRRSPNTIATSAATATRPCVSHPNVPLSQTQMRTSRTQPPTV